VVPLLAVRPKGFFFLAAKPYAGLFLPFLVFLFNLGGGGKKLGGIFRSIFYLSSSSFVCVFFFAGIQPGLKKNAKFSFSEARKPFSHRLP